jgi:hypothetical protein
VPAELGDWVPYIPEVVQEPAGPQTRRARRLVTPRVGDAFFLYAEYDDGNGMWIITGVSVD